MLIQEIVSEAALAVEKRTRAGTSYDTAKPSKIAKVSLPTSDGTGTHPVIGNVSDLKAGASVNSTVKQKNQLEIY